MKYYIDIQFFGTGRSKAGKGGGGGGLMLPAVVPTPSNRSGGQNVTLPEDQNIPEYIRRELGARGEPISIDDAVKNTNPHYKEDKMWRINCQRVAYAYEMQRRGYQVEAKPNDNPWDGFGNSYYGGFRHVFKDQTWTERGELGRTRKTVEKNIRARMAEWGEGARAVITVAWNNGRSGHIFNVEQRNGRLVAIDAQPGRRIDLTDYISYAKPSSVQISRIDNLTTPTNNLLMCVNRVGG